jgi:hypothetical protein
MCKPKDATVMKRTEEIKGEILAIWQILAFAKECFQYSLYLHKPETKEEREYLKHSHDFRFIAHVLWRMTVIELSKLFSNSANRDRFNVFHFIHKLKKAGHFGNAGINDHTISTWEQQIEINKLAIDQVLLLRDKVYGHTDPNKHLYVESDLTFEQTRKLIEIVESVITEIYSKVFDSHAIMDSPGFDRRRFDIIKVLAKAHDDREKEWRTMFLKERR